mmetsp:Transcript_41073/g.52960  ORF Transcript_41073/g.52960 Transcript_41073/m.52960 type:complete len:448 (+) Transcript_41073:56-1399(+)
MDGVRTLILCVPIFFLAIPLIFLSTLRLELVQLNDPSGEDNVPQIVEISRADKLSIKEFEDSYEPDQILEQTPMNASVEQQHEEESPHEFAEGLLGEKFKADFQEHVAKNSSGEMELAQPLGEAAYESSSGEVDFTLATMTTLDRVWLLEEHCRRWSGPIVAIVYLKNNVNATNLEPITNIKHHPKCNKLTVSEYYAIDNYEHFPVNKLRNLAIRTVTTSHYILLDIDFLPSSGLYRDLHDMSTKADLLPTISDPKAAFVLPAFTLVKECGTTSYCRKLLESLPKHKTEVLQCTVSSKCNVFDYWNPSGHHTTGYNQWFLQKQYSIRQIKCFESNRYEPYLVLKRHKDLPLYDERFIGYGKNKIQHILHLRYSGYTFYVLGEHFIIHSPHPKSSSRREWEGSSHRNKMDKLFAIFLEKLQENAPNVVTHLCAKQTKKKKKKKRKAVL